MSENNLTLEQKVDELYKIMKEMNRRQKINSWVKAIFWITMIGYSVYFTLYTIPNMIQTFTSLGSLGGSSGGNQNITEMIQNNSTVSDMLKNYLSQ